MNLKNVTTAAAAAALLLGLAPAATAHTIGIGWLDNGNGTVSLYSEHWHGSQSSPSTANGGLGVYDGSGNFLYKTQWTSVINNADLNGDDSAGATSSLTGYAPDPVNHVGYATGTNDWLVSDPLVLGNGTWGFFTGTNCCIDTMSTILYAQVTGVTSVDPGTGPGAISPVPLPAGMPLIVAALGMLGLVSRRRKSI